MIILILFLTLNLFASEENCKSELATSTHFLDPATLETWVADCYLTDDVLFFLMALVSKQVYGDPNLMDYNIKKVEPDENNPCPGRTSYILPDFYLPFLQAVHHNAGLIKSPCVMEIGTAHGLKFWPFAYTCENITLIANDRSKTVTKQFGQNIANNCYYAKNFTVKEIFGTHCNLLINNPSLKGAIDFIFSENVCHFFTPFEHQEFLKVINYLLCSEGQAYVLAATLSCKNQNRSDPIFAAYITAKTAKDNEMKKTYPGFLKSMICSYYEGGWTLGRTRFDIISSETPSNQERCGNTLIDANEDRSIIRQWETANYMTPQIFINAVKKSNKDQQTNLEVVKAFFVNYKGERCDTFEPNRGVRWACAILTKRP